MGPKGVSTRLFRAIVGLGLTTAACGGHVADPGPDDAAHEATVVGGQDAAEDAVFTFQLPEAGVDADAAPHVFSDAAIEHWVPVPIA